MLGLPSSTPPTAPGADRFASLITVCPGLGVELEGVLGPSPGSSLHLHAALAGGSQRRDRALAPRAQPGLCSPFTTCASPGPPSWKTGCGRPELAFWLLPLSPTADETLPGSVPSRSTNNGALQAGGVPGGEAGRGAVPGASAVGSEPGVSVSLGPVAEPPRAWKWGQDPSRGLGG